MRAASVKKEDVGSPQTYDLFEDVEEIDDSGKTLIIFIH